MSKRLPWGHKSRHCVYCGKVGPRTMVDTGWAHKRCIPKKPSKRPERFNLPAQIKTLGADSLLPDWKP